MHKSHINSEPDLVIEHLLAENDFVIFVPFVATL